MFRAYGKTLLYNRFNMKTFICREKVQRFNSGTVHYEHPLINQHVEIDENGCLLPIDLKT